MWTFGPVDGGMGSETVRPDHAGLRITYFAVRIA